MTSQVQIRLEWDTEFVSLEIIIDNTVNSMLVALHRKSDYVGDASNEKWKDRLLAPQCARLFIRANTNQHTNMKTAHKHTLAGRKHTHRQIDARPGERRPEQRNKGDSLSVMEKVRSSSASKKSFQIEGIKHFLSTSSLCHSLTTRPKPNLLFSALFH